MAPLYTASDFVAIESLGILMLDLIVPLSEFRARCQGLGPMHTYQTFGKARPAYRAGPGAIMDKSANDIAVNRTYGLKCCIQSTVCALKIQSYCN